MRLTQYVHTAILVSNLQAAARFYGDILGLTPVDRPFTFPGIWYQLGAMQIHLIEDKDFKNAYSPEKWGRDRHLAFSVTDLAAAKEHLLAHGCEVQMSGSGRPALFTKDPDGNVIELSEMQK